ncbi:MAG: metalloregulator ArsR/SmtB family transcription factor [Actinomycetota bacterium]|nr:metalloregulator ArsR/SmtB family transcription factor [Actinomycetota bacterium]
MSETHDHPVDPARVSQARQTLISSEDAEHVAELFRLLGDPVRARILYALAGTDELCVGDIALTLGVAESSVSYALRLLRTAGVVRNRREGRMIYYRLVDGFMVELLELFREQVHLNPEAD